MRVPHNHRGSRFPSVSPSPSASPSSPDPLPLSRSPPPPRFSARDAIYPPGSRASPLPPARFPRFSSPSPAREIAYLYDREIQLLQNSPSPYSAASDLPLPPATESTATSTTDPLLFHLV
ncbi:hypothetical protein DAI22_09g016000 [Oryza sativa Japonica Group]|nr:hypothetical protein DAI22_09g016000 [Oryza sativa Japonica Group]